jgi:Protein of unknown function (DUF2911)
MLFQEDIMKKVALLTALLFVVSMVAAAQMNMPQEKKPLSPPANAECKFSDGKAIKVDYSSPRAKGRKIFGSASENALVPYGEVWRTGANNATTFVTDAAVMIGDKDVPAGNYTIFTVPNADKWTLIINKKTGEWGIPYKYESDELGRVPMSVSKTSGPVENFAIAFDQAGKKCTLRMEWENTQASVEITEK